MIQTLPECDLEVVRPSALGRVLRCPGSRRLVKMAPPKTSSRYADEGTAAHFIAEKCFTEGLSPIEFYGQKVVVEGHTYPANNETLQAVSKFVSHVRDDQRVTEQDALWFFEKKLWIEELNNGGTVDCAAVSYGQPRIKVHDYKHGSGVYVSEVWNDQFLAYALSLLNTYFRGSNSLDEIMVEMTVHQPRFPDTKPSRTFTISGYQLVEWRDTKLLPGLAETRKKGAPLKGGAHCQFCPGKNICTEYLTVQRPKFRHIPVRATPVPSGFIF